MKFHLNSVYFAVDEKSALREAQAFRDRFAHLYPSTVKSFEDDLQACLAHLKCPPRHRKFITSTNLVERSFEEERRRSKVIPRFFNEKSGLKSEFGSTGLVFATLIRASQSWRRVAITFDEEIKLVELRDKLNQQDRGEQTTAINLRMPQLGDKIFQKK